MKKVMSLPIERRAKGNKGEDIACQFLEKEGFSILSRNFQRKWGELDIIAEKDKILHFFEVKSVTFIPKNGMSDSHRPEDNVDGWKMKHLRKIIETYIAEFNKGDTEFQFHVLCVYMNIVTKKARVKWLRNLIL